jgi:signal transduction histidine kinase
MPEGSPLPSFQVLLIDDDLGRRQALQDRLTGLPGWQLELACAADASEAFAALRRKSFDLAFLNAQIARGDGIRVLEQIRQLYPKVAVVVMSGAGSEKTAVEAVRRGAVEYVVERDILQVDMSTLMRRAVEMHRLQTENTELRQINRMKDEFISSASHELRTPLAVILGYAKTMEDGELGALTPPQALAVKAIRTRGERLLEMLTRLLTFKESRMGMQEVVLRPTDLGIFLQRLLDEDWPSEKRKGIELERAAPEAPVWALADPEFLREVVNGLVSNALKFSPPQTRVRVSLTPRGPQEAWIRVEDQGRGIIPEALPRIFDPFTHTDNDMTRSVSGLGLGLALARQIIELHGGRIWLESEGADRGTTAIVALSLVQPDAPVVIVEKERRVDKKRILIVEDNADIVEIIRLFMAGFSHNIVITATDQGQQALELMIRQRFDLLILDLLLPGLSGTEILERMRRMPQDKRMPVLILSGHPEAAKDAVQNKGADDFLLKPFNRNRFIDKVLQLLGLERRAHPRT